MEKERRKKFVLNLTKSVGENFMEEFRNARGNLLKFYVKFIWKTRSMNDCLFCNASKI